jgi:hypothetical protein
VSPKYRNRVREVSSRYRSHGVKHEPGLHTRNQRLNPDRSHDLYKSIVALLVRKPPVTRAFIGGGDGIRTHGLYIANVEFLAF